MNLKDCKIWEIIREYDKQQEYISALYKGLEALDEADLKSTRVYVDMEQQYTDEVKKLENFKKLQVEVK